MKVNFHTGARYISKNRLVITPSQLGRFNFFGNMLRDLFGPSLVPNKQP